METGREATGYYKWKSIDRYAAQPPCKNKFPWIPIDPACREENSTAFIIDIMKALKRKKRIGIIMMSLLGYYSLLKLKLKEIAWIKRLVVYCILKSSF